MTTFETSFSGIEEGLAGKSCKLHDGHLASNRSPGSIEFWQVLQKIELDENNEPVDKNFMGRLREAETIKRFSKQELKQAMPFASYMMKQAGL